MSEPESCNVFCDPKEALLFGKVLISTNASPSKTVLDLESFSFVCGDSCLCPRGCRRGWQQCLSPSMNAGDLLSVALAKVVEQHPDARYHQGLAQSLAAVHPLFEIEVDILTLQRVIENAVADFGCLQVCFCSTLFKCLCL